jgi:hypothetical protein
MTLDDLIVAYGDALRKAVLTHNGITLTDTAKLRAGIAAVVRAMAPVIDRAINWETPRKTDYTKRTAQYFINEILGSDAEAAAGEDPRSSRLASTPDVCEWSEDARGIYATACGFGHMTRARIVLPRSKNFCPKCGKPILFKNQTPEIQT